MLVLNGLRVLGLPVQGIVLGSGEDRKNDGAKFFQISSVQRVLRKNGQERVNGTRDSKGAGKSVVGLRRRI